MNIQRPLLREVNHKDKPRLLALQIEPIDNGYICIASFHGGGQRLYAKNLVKVCKWLKDWQQPKECLRNPKDIE